jgi:hypothetical protein
MKSNQARDAPARKKAGARGHETFGGRRHGGLEILVGGAGDVGVEVPRHDGEPLKRSSRLERLPLPLQPVQPLDVSAHGVALAADEFVPMLVETSDRALAGLARRLGVMVEPLRDPAQLVDSATEALAVLLSVLGRLRRDETPKKAASEPEGAGDPGHVGFSSAMRLCPQAGRGVFQTRTSRMSCSVTMSSAFATL